MGRTAKKVVELKKKTTQLKNNYGKIKVKKNKTEKEVVTKLKFFPPFVLFFITMIDNTISAAQHRTCKDVLKNKTRGGAGGFKVHSLLRSLKTTRLFFEKFQKTERLKKTSSNRLAAFGNPCCAFILQTSSYYGQVYFLLNSLHNLSGKCYLVRNTKNDVKNNML